MLASKFCHYFRTEAFDKNERERLDQIDKLSIFINDAARFEFFK